MSAPTSRDERRAALLAFLRTIQKPGAPVEDARDDVSLVEAGLIDSLAVLEIVSHLETACGLDFAEAGVDPGDLTTIAGILDLVERLQPPS